MGTHAAGKSGFSFLLLVALALYLLPCGCDRKSPPAAASDKPLPAFQTDLLTLAFDTASSIPADPHIKDRSRAQETVVTTFLQLDQPRRARKLIESIDTWRQGLCYADLAFYYAQHGRKKEAESCLQSAEKISRRETGQQWRRDRIRAKIAQTFILLGNPEKAETFVTDMIEPEKGLVAKARAMKSEEETFGDSVKTIDAQLAIGGLDVTKNALEVCARLFDRFYTDPARRMLIEEKIKTSWNEVPGVVRLELWRELIEAALTHEDRPKALDLVNEAEHFIENSQWPPEGRIRLTAELIKLCFRAGDTEKARADADRIRTLFNTEREKIIDIYRARAMRPLAEAYQAMGDTEAALSVYKQVIEEGTVNPNSRPRALDLSAVCCSMALSAAEPDPELWTRLHQIRKELGQPW